jgi:hypothetical protein
MESMIMCITMGGYSLLLSYDPCDLFEYFNVTEMHGLSLEDCKAHDNNENQAYIAGLTNEDPNDPNKRFIYINLSRCGNDVQTTLLIFHECMHHALWRYNYDVENKEEDMISWAELEARIIYDFIKPLRGKVVKTALSVEKE